MKRRAVHTAQMVMINSLSVMYLPSSAGMFSGRIFAVTGFQSYKNINSGTISSRAEKIYRYPASFSHEFPLYTRHVGTPDIAKYRHNAGNSNISTAPLHDSNSAPLHKSMTSIWHNNMTPQSSIIASNFQNRLSVSFIANLLSDGTKITDFAPTDYRREQSQHTESISYRVLPYTKLQRIIDIRCDKCPSEYENQRGAKIFLKYPHFRNDTSPKCPADLSAISLLKVFISSVISCFSSF